MSTVASKTLDSVKCYTVAWLAALPEECAAAMILLDGEHKRPADFVPHAADTNCYTWGRMCEHNIVIVLLPSGEYGLLPTADVTSGLRASLPHIRVGLLVGIAAGVTGEKEEAEGKISIDRDIRLGDIAVSNPDGSNGGVVQYDLYKAKRREDHHDSGSGSYQEAKGFLNAPPRALLSALNKLRAKHSCEDSRVVQHLKSFERNKQTRIFGHPGARYRSQSDSDDSSDSANSDNEDPLRVGIREGRVTRRTGTKFRKLRDRHQPTIHYGTIASGNVLLKDKKERDYTLSRLKEDNVHPICFEMEAAGIMSSFPSLVIRGICDYGDERKNDTWQKYAAATAAAFAKEFLEYLDPQEVEQAPPIGVEKAVKQLTATITQHVSDSRQRQVDKWLSSLDPSTNLNKAKMQRHPQTGLWFLQSQQYIAWREKRTTALWLHGLPGCGKTVLSSSIINDMQQLSREHIILYFFFDFNDTDKQSFEKMLRSLISQMYHQNKRARDHLDQLYSACRDGQIQPEAKTLVQVLKAMIGQSEDVVIALDALDECKTRTELHTWLQSLTQIDLQIIVTSRKEHDIEVSLTKWLPLSAIIPIQQKPVDEDIRAVVRSRLVGDEEMKRWRDNRDVCEEIETELMKKADGMFRWATCQLDTLRDCLDLPALRNALSCLPKDLDETYGRILANIPHTYRPNAIRILQFLLYTPRPLRLEEAVDAVAVTPNINDCKKSFCVQNRMPDPSEIVRYCSSLVKLTSRPRGRQDESDPYESDADASDEINRVVELQLAHFSVKEYLTSSKLEDNFKRSLDEICARASIVEVSISYLLAASELRSECKDTPAFPLARLSAESWMGHSKEVEAKQATVLAWSEELFATRTAYRYWLQLFDPDRPWQGISDDLALETPPLYFACLGGLAELANRLILRGADVNAQGGRYGGALQASSLEGHEVIVRLLIEEGADRNAQGGLYGTALQAASTQGHEDIVRLLIEQGADVNAQGGKYYGSPLQAASAGGHDATVRLLIEQGANVNARGGEYGTALQATSLMGYEAIARLLIEKGADVNAYSVYYDNVLQATSCWGNEAIVRLLIEQGANVNAQGGRYGNALQAASAEGHDAIVRLLIEQGANVNAQGGNYGNALQAASIRGYEAIARLLIEKGADVDA